VITLATRAKEAINDASVMVDKTNNA